MVAHTPFPPLIARGKPSFDSLCDTGAFAWEILRRRADYRPSLRGAGVQRIGEGQPPVELLTGPPPDPLWGLQFCRRSRYASRRCPPLLAP